MSQHYEIDLPESEYPRMGEWWTPAMFDVLKGAQLIELIRTYGVRQVERRWGIVVSKRASQ